MTQCMLQVNCNMLCNVFFVTTDMEQSQQVPNSQLVSSKVRQMNVQKTD